MRWFCPWYNEYTVFERVLWALGMPTFVGAIGFVMGLIKGDFNSAFAFFILIWIIGFPIAALQAKFEFRPCQERDDTTPVYGVISIEEVD